MMIVNGIRHRKHDMTAESAGQLGIDSALTASVIFIPHWLYAVSAWAGALATILGFFLVLYRFCLMIRMIIKPNVYRSASNGSNEEGE